MGAQLFTTRTSKTTHLQSPCRSTAAYEDSVRKGHAAGNLLHTLALLYLPAQHPQLERQTDTQPATAATILLSGRSQGHSARKEYTGVQSRQSGSKSHGHTNCLLRRHSTQATHPLRVPPKGLSSPGPCGPLGLTMVALWAPWHLGYKTPQHSSGLWPSGPEPGLPTYVPASGRTGAQRWSPLRGPGGGGGTQVLSVLPS